MHQYMWTHHQQYFFAFSQACGGTRQDIGPEGCPRVYINLQYGVPFFYHRLFVSNDNIWQKSLLITLKSVEIIAIFRVLSILFMLVCLQTCWLGGNVKDLAKWDFGVLDMSDVVDTL